VRKKRKIGKRRAAREAGWTGKRRQGGRPLGEKDSGGKSWIQKKAFKESIGYQSKTEGELNKLRPGYLHYQKSNQA